MKKLFSFVTLILSLQVFAGHDCKLTIAEMEDFRRPIGELEASTSHGILQSINYGTILVEDEKISRSGKIKNQIKLDVHAVANGWDNEQETTFVVVRKGYKKEKRVLWETASEKVTVFGTEKKTIWFEIYKLDIDCKANNEN